MMLHNEARKLMVEAYEKNKDAAQTASNFSVSTSTVYRLARQMKKVGSVALRVNERGRKPLLSEEDHERIRDEIEAQNDITIEEIREHLKLAASYSTVERAIRKMGYTLKKKTLHASERERLRCEGEAGGMGRVYEQVRR